MEKQSLIKYRCALVLVLVLLISSNNMAIAQKSPISSPADKLTIVPSPATKQNDVKTRVVDDDKSMWFSVILSILALAASGGAIALTILKNKKIDRTIDFLEKDYNTKLMELENKYTKLSTSQVALQANQPSQTISRNSTSSNNTKTETTSNKDISVRMLETSIDSLTSRIIKLENTLKTPRNNEQSVENSQNYSYNQSHNLESNFNPFNETTNLRQSEVMQPLENIAYVELVNTYNTNPKLLEQKAIKVSEDKDSIARRHTDSSQKIVLRQTTNGNYWVIHDDVGINCWLLPKINLRINQYNYETTKVLFECHGYQPEYFNKFKLIKPAKVIPLSADEQTWQIHELGILEFSIEA